MVVQVAGPGGRPFWLPPSIPNLSCALMSHGRIQYECQLKKVDYEKQPICDVSIFAPYIYRRKSLTDTRICLVGR
ncbi:unnamed protein product [Cylicocyclus nassatus]|uniref:Uncharacterized protein n=1 Tax=Cylicocyclus nassatus TaxID=53992 RepID=A0AA36M269_CYLNA|nr:unnamed protein product [Cylicocyclus nassatus]